MITFLLDGWYDFERKEIEFTIFELGLRLKIPFKIVRTINSLSTDEYIIRYSPLRSNLRNKFSRLIQLNKLHETDCKVISNGNKLYWGVKYKDSLDLVVGIRNLLLFGHENNLDETSFDKYNRIKPNSHPFLKNNIMHEAFIENNVEYINNLIEQKWGITPTKKYWGDYEKIVIVTHDCDGPQLHSKFSLLRSFILGYLKQNKKERNAFNFGLLTKLFNRSDPYWNFNNWLDFEKDLNVTSTLFIYPGNLQSTKKHFHDPHYRFSDLNKSSSLINKYYEIGLHLGILEKSKKDFLSAINKLQEISNSAIDSCRAHYWAYDWHNPYNFWKLLNKCGIKNDASLSIQGLGFRNGTALPITASAYFNGLDNASFLVFPTTFMDAYTIHALSSQSPSNEKYKYIAKNPLVVLDWHIRTFSNIGPWENYLNGFLQVIDDLNRGKVKYISLKEASSMWKEYIKNTFLGII